jgi:hypothetical protein
MRRYETATGLASDIQRHLNNEPVVACPPSTVYRFQKLVRRNKLAFAGASAVAVALVVGAAVSTWQAIRATHFRRQAEAEALTNRQNLYAAHMNLANLTLETHNLGRFRELLEKHVPKSEARTSNPQTTSAAGNGGISTANATAMISASGPLQNAGVLCLFLTRWPLARGRRRRWPGAPLGFQHPCRVAVV